MNFFKMFRRNSEINDPDIGKLSYDNKSWVFPFKLNQVEIEVSIDAKNKELDKFAKSYWLNIQPEIENFWKAAIQFTLQELEKWETPFIAKSLDFKLNSISIHREHSFENGHLTFWFDIKSDLNGTFYVSFINEKPSSLHRDS